MGREASSSMLRHLLERSCRELDERLRRGEAVGAETYLARYPSLATDTEAAIELICHEFLTREELGDRPSPEEFLQRFAHWRDRLSRQLTMHAVLSRHLAAATDREDSTGEQASGFAQLTPRKGSYRILREVSRGNNVIYEAIQSGTRRRVALKCIGEGDQATSEARAQLLAEARTASRLRHPNIVQVFDVGVQDDTPFLAMEFIDGQSLARWLKDARPTPSHAARITEILAKALQHAHAQGVIHRDLSPANIMLTTEGVPIITDFGLALHSGQTSKRKRLGGIVGTPGYMAPEQVGGASGVSATADLHALGAILYEMLTGRPPFPTELSLEAMERLIHETAIPPRQIRHDVPATLETICLKCLAKEPSQRYASAAALADDLSRFHRGESIRPGLAFRKLPHFHGLEKVALLLGVVALGGLLWQHQRARVELGLAQARLADQAAAARLLNESEARAQHADRQRQRLAYALDLRRAQVAIDEHEPMHATHLLERLRPQEGDPDPRGFEWFALYRQLTTPWTILPDLHGAAINAAAVAPNGQEFVTGDLHGTLVVWDAQTLRPRHVVPGHESIVAQLRYTPDGQRFLSVCGDPRGRRQLKLWDASSVQLLGEPVVLQADPENLTITADSRAVVLREHHPADRARLWSITPRGLVALRTDLDARHLAVSPDGKRLAVVARDESLSVLPLNAETGAPSWTGTVKGTIEALAWHPNGQTLVVATAAPSLVAITPGKGVAWTSPRPRDRPIRQLRFDPSGGSLIVTDAGGLAVLDAANGSLRHDCLPADGRPWNWAVIAPDGTSALTFDPDQETLLWNLQNGRPEPVAGLEHTELRAAAFFQDSRRIVLGTEDGQPRYGQPGVTVPQLDAAHQGEAWCVAFSPSGALVASGGDDNAVRLWSIADNRLEPKQVLEGHSATVSSLAFTPDGKRLVSGDLAGGLILWDLERVQRIATLNPPKVGVQIRCLRIAPNGRSLATAWSDGALRIWDLASQSVQTVLTGHRDRACSLAISTDGRWLASASEDATVQLWDVQQPQPTRQWGRSLPASGMAVTFSPNGDTLAVGLRNGRIELRDTSTGDPRLSLQGPAAEIRALAFTPDGETLLSGARDGQVHAWDPQLGQERIRLRRHPAGVFGLALSPDGTQLVSCDHDGRLWLTSAPRDPAALAPATADPPRPSSPNP